MILLMDVIIIASSVLVPSFTADGAAIPFVAKVITAVYGMIIVSVDSYVIDLYLAGSKQSVQLFILSRHFSEIADMITQDFRRGVTVLNGKGWYTKQETEVLMAILPKTDLNILLRRVKQIDSDVFLSISSVSGVYGKGFDTIKKTLIFRKKQKFLHHTPRRTPSGGILCLSYPRRLKPKPALFQYKGKL
jgi:uncharacterized membrane-anchored protein YitT (DUF2179 family)